MVLARAVSAVLFGSACRGRGGLDPDVVFERAGEGLGFEGGGEETTD